MPSLESMLSFLLCSWCLFSMREWEAYYFSLLAERDALDARGDSLPPAYTTARRPSNSPNDDHMHARSDSRLGASSRDQQRESYHAHGGNNSAPTGKRFDSSSIVGKGNGLTSMTGSSGGAGGRRSRSRSRDRDRVRSGDRKRDSRDSRDRDRISRHPSNAHDATRTLPPTSSSSMHQSSAAIKSDYDRTRDNSNDNDDQDDIADMYVSATHRRSRSRSLSN